MRLATTAVLCLLLIPTAAQADVKLPAIIGDNMVLQEGVPVPIWGTAEPGEAVTVTVGEQKPTATADEHGKWMVKLEPLASDEPIEVTIEGKNSITLKNVLIGQVWVCSGQSNMEWPVSLSNEPEKEIAAAEFPKIRLFQAKKAVASQPQADTEGKWVECSPATIPNFTAVGYFFGRDIHQNSGRPVGLVQTAWGGTPAEAWTSRPTLKSQVSLQPILDRWRYVEASNEAISLLYQAYAADWAKARDAAVAENRTVPEPPRQPNTQVDSHLPSGLYNGMIAPLVPYAIKGAIWYQGESNAGRAYQYRTLFPAMIQDWRAAWGQGDFPFLFVQLANFQKTLEEPADSAWAELREAQTMTLSLPYTGQAVIIDIGEADDIHPRNKQDVGKRLARAADTVAYAKEGVGSGPLYKSMEKKDGTIRLTFNHIGSGLATRDDAELSGFAIAGEDKKFVWAKAVIEGDQIVVSAEGVTDPVAVRYAWADNPICNLYNKEGLPASPFRTDDWPGVTVGNK